MNLDVLLAILAPLDPADLATCALVSRLFLAGALPALYARIEYTSHHAKRTASPFATLAVHPHLVVHLRRIAVHAVPLLDNTPSPPFLNDLANTLRAATSIRAFVCTVNVLPPLLPHLLDKPRLHHLRVNASLGSRQIQLLQRTTALHSLVLDFPSGDVIDVLPKWSTSMQRTLAHLTLYMTQHLDAPTLNATLAHLPRLRGLHVIGCLRITHAIVLRALSHTPDLLELSLTIFPSQETTLPVLNFSIPPLTHLSIDIRASYPALKYLVARIVARLSPRRALAICGGWIGEIKASSERTDPPQDPPPQANGDAPDPPLLSPPHPHAQGPLPFPFPFPLPPNVDPAPDPIPNPIPDPSLLSSLPLSLSILHLPLLSPAALRELIERCEAIQVLGIVIGTSFAAHAPPPKLNKPTPRLPARPTPQSKTVPDPRPEITLLSSILSRAKHLEELLVDTSPTDIPSATDARTHGPHGSFRPPSLLTQMTVRMLMRESPFLRRVVGEGRIWESPSPTPTSPLPFPHFLPIDLSLSKARYGPGAMNHHGYSLPGFGSPGGGYAQVEAENDHWFWLRGSASGGKVYSDF